MEGRAVIVGAAVFVPFTRIQGASTSSPQYCSEAKISVKQQSCAVVPFMPPQSLPPQTSHMSEQQTVPLGDSTPLRPLEQLDVAISASQVFFSRTTHMG